MMSYKTNLNVKKKKKIGRLGRTKLHYYYFFFFLKRTKLHYLKRSLKLKQSLKPILNKKIVKNY